MIDGLVNRFPLLRNWIPTGVFAQRVGALAGGTLAAQAVAVLVTPVLTRLYSAAAFGNLQLYQSLLMFVGTVIALRYELAIFLPEDDTTAMHVTVAALLMVAVTGVMVALGVAVLLDHPGWLGQFAALGSLLWWLVVAAVVVGIYQVLNNWCLRRHAYGVVATSRFVQSLGQMGAQLLFGLTQATTIGLIAGDALGRAAAVGPILRQTVRKDLSLFRSVSWDGVTRAMARYRRFPTVSLPATLINSGSVVIPSLGLGTLFGPQVLGWYALTERALGVPTMLIGQAISQVFMSTAGGSAPDRDERLFALFRRTVFKLAMIGVVPYLIVAIWGPWLFSTVFGEQWRVAGEYARVLAFPQFVGFVTWPLIPTLTLIERQDVQLVWDCVRLAVVVGTFVVSQWQGWSSLTVIAVLGAAMALTWLIHLGVSYVLLRKRVNLLRSQRRDDLAGSS